MKVELSCLVPEQLLQVVVWTVGARKFVLWAEQNSIVTSSSRGSVSIEETVIKAPGGDLTVLPRDCVSSRLILVGTGCNNAIKCDGEN